MVDRVGNDAVRKRVRAVAAAYLGSPVDELPDPADEPIVLRAGTAAVSMQLVEADPPLIRVCSPVLRTVERSPELLGRLNDVNARLNFVRMFWRDGTVFASYELLALTVDDHELAHACDTVGAVADHYDVRWREEFGGELAFDDEAGQSRGGANL